MKNRIVCLLLLIGLLCTQFSRYVVVAGFDLNQRYIAEMLCVNKSRPWMHCNGRCYLMKKLKQAAQKERSAERENQKNNIQVAICSTPHQFSFEPLTERALFIPQGCFLLPENPSAVFQPPRA